MPITEVTAQRATIGGTLSLAYPGNVTAGSLLVIGGGTGGNMRGITATGAGAPASWIFCRPSLLVGGLTHPFLAFGIAGATGACTVTLVGASFPSYTITEFTFTASFLDIRPALVREDDDTGTAVSTASLTVADDSVLLGARRTTRPRPSRRGRAGRSLAATKRSRPTTRTG